LGRKTLEAGGINRPWNTLLTACLNPAYGEVDDTGLTCAGNALGLTDAGKQTGIDRGLTAADRDALLNKLIERLSLGGTTKFGAALSDLYLCLVTLLNILRALSIQRGRI
jgi:hypothetical protein